MKNRLETMYLGTKIRVCNALCHPLTVKKQGANELVITLLLIVISVGLCIIFREQLSQAFSGLMTKISNNIDKITEASFGTTT